jgi:hypothetical protein
VTTPTVHECCEAAANDSRSSTSSPRWSGIAGYLLPGTALMLLPKCPACLAAYIAIGTGINLSASTVSHWRILLVLACVGWLLYLAGRHLYRRISVATAPTHR